MHRFDGCQCDECMARRVGELVQYAMQLEQACIEAKHLLDAGHRVMAWQLIEAAAGVAERRDLTGEMHAAARDQVIADAAEARREGRLH